ncbi:MAG: hypothetical protein CVT88_07875 [Candidatus Altiarchaeales archaeon HGW-Altiarchaeales-1]|nr:MAG: hypothetical protein CVT88_07875 [Candidatus Altiarchaeales archaeon HGW-Altiarchaeales-1]
MKILIAAGATKEYIDAIRFISNDSSGKMGIALLKEAIKRKHTVKFIYGSGSALTKRTIKKISDTDGVEKVINAITAKQKFPDVFVVAFKAEYDVSDDALKNSAIEKLRAENLDMVVANDVAKSKFGSDKAEVFLISKDEIRHVKGSKIAIAGEIFNFMEKEIAHI